MGRSSYLKFLGSPSLVVGEINLLELPTKRCFVISPIGDEGSPTRIHSDRVLRHIIQPAATECGYSVLRADQDARPGMITSQVITHLIEDDLVVADLTDRNPNVFYELAIRHAVKKPVVQVMRICDSLPFDISQSRTIQFDLTNPDSVADCRDLVTLQIRAVEQDPSRVDNPITQAVTLTALAQTADPEAQSSRLILESMNEITERFYRLERSFLGANKPIEVRLDVLLRQFQLVPANRTRVSTADDPVVHQMLELLDNVGEMTPLQRQELHRAIQINIESGVIRSVSDVASFIRNYLTRSIFPDEYIRQ